MAFKLPDLPEGVENSDIRWLALSVLNDNRWDALIPLVDALQGDGRLGAVARIRDALADLTAQIHYLPEDDGPPRRLKYKIDAFKTKVAKAVWRYLYSFNSTAGVLADLVAKATAAQEEAKDIDASGFASAADVALQLEESRERIRRFSEEMTRRRAE